MFSDQLYNRIGNLKVHSQDGDSPGLRMRVGNTVSSLDIQPSGMPPSAILIIRKLYDPMPGVLRADAGEWHRPGKNARNSWRNALRMRMSELYRDARQPATTVLVGELNAVLFADRAELLACFCRDVVRGHASQWWWKSHFGEYLRAMAPAETASHLLMESPRIVPAVMSRLASWRCAIMLIRTIDAYRARHMITAVLHEFGLADLDEGLSACVHENDRRDQYETAETDSLSFVDGSGCEPPWQGFFKDEISEPGLGKEQLGLLGIARLLQDSATILRTDDFQHRFVDWWSSFDRVDMRSGDSDLQSILQHRARIKRLRQRVRTERSERDACNVPNVTFAGLDNRRRSASQDASCADPNAGSSNSIVAENPEPTEHSKTTDSPECGAPSTQQQTQRAIQGESGFHESVAASPAPERTSDAEEAASKIAGHRSLEHKPIAEPDTADAIEDVSDALDDVIDVDRFFTDTFVDIRLGGLFYLINLLAQLEFPQCLAVGCKVDQQISRWALLDAVARALLGEYYLSHRSDPVWNVLASLDHRRQKTTVGKGFQCPSDYLMPEKWFRYLANDVSPEFYWAVHNKRLRIWSETGLVAESRIADPRHAESQVVATLYRYRQDVDSRWIQPGRFARAPIANRKHLAALGIDRELARLLAFVLPAVRRYLQDILAPSTASPATLLNTLLGFDGRIFVSSSHIDLVADINSTSLSIRRSGLDQDPGWLPEYGRVVLFHFE